MRARLGDGARRLSTGHAGQRGLQDAPRRCGSEASGDHGAPAEKPGRHRTTQAISSTMVYVGTSDVQALEAAVEAMMAMY